MTVSFTVVAVSRQVETVYVAVVAGVKMYQRLREALPTRQDGKGGSPVVVPPEMSAVTALR